MRNVIKVNENLILHYESGFLYRVEKPKDNVTIKIDSSGTKEWWEHGALIKK